MIAACPRRRHTGRRKGGRKGGHSKVAGQPATNRAPARSITAAPSPAAAR